MAKPVNISAEQAILAAALLDRDCAGKILDIKFSDKRNQDMQFAIKELYMNNVEIDPIAIGNVLQKNNKVFDNSYVWELLGNVAAPSVFEHHLKIQTEVSEAGRVWDICQTALRKLSSGEFDLTDKLIQALIAGNTDDTTITSAGDVTRETLDRIEAIIEARETGGDNPYSIPYGISVLDNITNGMQNQDLIIIGARTGEGKSAFANQIIMNVSVKTENPKTGLLISLEMDNVQNMIRMIANKTGVENYKIAGGYIPDNEWENLFDKATELSNGKILFGQCRDNKIDTVISTIMKAKATHNIDYAVVDYLQLVWGDGKDIYSRVTDVAKKLKSTAKALDIPIIAPCQLSRAVTKDLSRSTKQDVMDNPIPRLSDLRSSGDIEQEAGTIIFIHANEFYQNAGDRPNEVEGELILAKSRFCPSDSFDMIFDRRYLRFII